MQEWLTTYNSVSIKHAKKLSSENSHVKFGLPLPDGLRTQEDIDTFLEEFQDHVAKLDTPIRGGPRKHHYIPQFHMKRFASKHSRMIRMPLPAHPPPSRSPTHVKNLAVTKDFYTIRTDKGESALIENFMSVWDYHASQIIGRMTDPTHWPITDEYKLKMSFWITLLHCRSPALRRKSEAAFESMMEMLIRMGPNADEARTRELRFLQHQNEYVRLMLELTCQIMEHVLARRWTVIRLHKDGLVLPDVNPVLIPGPPHPTVGVGFATAPEIIMPLDRSHLLCMHTYDAAEDLIEIPTEASDWHIRHYNNLLVSGAYQEVFCHQTDYHHVLQIASRHGGAPLMGVDGPMTEGLRIDGVNAPPERRSPRRYREYGSTE